MKKYLLLLLTTLSLFNCFSTQLLIPMDNKQSNHLKAYGIAFWTLENGLTIEWLLNYRGGSFLMPHLQSLEEELIIRNVKYTTSRTFINNFSIRHSSTILKNIKAFNNLKVSS
jgi:hypothetical protein